MVRAFSPEMTARWPGTEIMQGDVLVPDSLDPILAGVHTAYYLIHSFMLGNKDFEPADNQAARNFREAASRKGIQRIIYLGGLGNFSTMLSPHLRSRMDVAQEFQLGEVPVTILRAAVIIGSGSASYEIIKNLVQNVRVMLMPPWSGILCQPIAVRDVIKYLVGVLETEVPGNKVFDIGGPDILSYRDMLIIQAEVIGKRLWMIRFPFNMRRLYTYIVSLLTPVPGPVTRCLMGSVMNEVICQNKEICQKIPFKTVSYKESLEKALSLEEHNNIRTRWSDAYPPAYELSKKLHEMDREPDFFSEYSIQTSRNASELFETICHIGGKEGWFHYNWMWRLRGYVDRILLGVGSARGRKNSGTLTVNDVVDFWRVEEVIQDQLLLLRAEMKLPGLAWLRFSIQEKEGFNRLTVKAFFYTDKFSGRLYWYTFLPFHYFIFKSLIRQITLR
jgi:uncharacterized protein YbjT (DUF2867 family)